jgi:hypothetical protein
MHTTYQKPVPKTGETQKLSDPGFKGMLDQRVPRESNILFYAAADSSES